MAKEITSKSERIVGVLGDFITLVSRKNKNLEVTRLVGVTTEKEIITSFASDYETNLKICQIIEAEDFVVRLFNFEMTRKLAIARYDWEGPSVVSSQYHVFRVINSPLLGEYLFLLFKKAITEKRLLYMCFGGIRGALSYKSFCSLPISIPSLKIQQRIINRHQTISRFIEVKKKINELLEKKMTAYFHVLFDDLKEYTFKNFGEIMAIIKNGRPPRSNKYLESLYFCKKGGIPWLQVKDVTKQKRKFVSYTSEQLTEEGFKRARCKIVPAGFVVVVVGSGVNAKALGSCMISFCDLTLSTTLWGLKGNILAEGGAFRFLLLIFTFWSRRTFQHLKEWLMLLLKEFLLTSKDLILSKLNFHPET